MTTESRAIPTEANEAKLSIPKAVTPLPEPTRRGSSAQSQGKPEAKPNAKQGLRFEHLFSTPDTDPFDLVSWEKRDAVISGEAGQVVFEQRGVEIPTFWSQTATNVVTNKYFRGQMDTPERESSVRQLIGRVVDTIHGWGKKDGYFASNEDGNTFAAELKHLLLHQMACFNSPVWFNVGTEPHPQCSACFINSVNDDLESIFGLAKTEGMLFKYGSGAGSNLSSLRSSKEPLSGGGTSSGPVSFMRGYDAFAGVVKSGGKTRRAAKMVILNADHPDVEEFITCKEIEEKKAQALIDAGYDGGFNVPGGAYDSVAYQNANHSVRAQDSFMEAVENDQPWTTHAVTDGGTIEELSAKELMDKIAQGTWVCGDPGLQFDTTINDWHTCPESAPINASNPCSEYMFVDDSACNLASMNLLRFWDDKNGFDATGFRHACEVVITAQEILVDNASYPTPAIAENSRAFRPLGIGYANLGALLMANGLPYDSDIGRNYSATLTALQSGACYTQSARIAETRGAFEAFEINREPMLRVIGKHAAAVEDIDAQDLPSDLVQAARSSWSDALQLGAASGFRNSQISAIAPTGTIAFMMDCDTTGIEPDIALVKYKKLVGGGLIKIVNQTVPQALSRLGYDEPQREQILQWVEEHDTIEGAPHLADEHLAVFDCAFKATNGSRSIHYSGHLKMMAAAQPFISGAISKTINMPEEATVEEIREAYMESWRLGLKSVAIYRDGSKRTQPLSTSLDQESEETAVANGPARRKLPDERQAITHKFAVAGHEGYITVGLYDDGKPGELFLVMAKEGSTISGLMDGLATSVSIALQYGVPLETLIRKFSHTRFEPSGFTGNREIPMAKSITDYVFRWLGSKFLPREEQQALGIILRDEAGNPELVAPTILLASASDQQPNSTAAKASGYSVFVNQQDAPSCADCGSIMVRNGACYQCSNCGASSGCG